MPPMLMIAGPPGSGKGTLCDNIVRDYGVVHISGGDLLRAEVKRGTALGNEAKGYMAKGQLVPDRIVTGMIFARLQSDDVKQRGALLDGFPRNGAQAKELQTLGLKWDAMVVLEVSEAALMERSAGRRLDPTTGNIYHLKFKPPPPHIFGRLVIRPDDQPEKQRHRIGIYNDTKRDLVAAFAAIVVPVNAEQPIPAVYEEFKRKVPLDTPPKAKL